MKKNVMTHFLLLVLVIMGSIVLMANKQQEPNKDKDTFFTLQKRFYDYWKDKTPEKGMGYKQFKRWEYFMKSRINPDGTIPDHSAEIWRVISEEERQAGSCLLAANWTEIGPRKIDDNQALYGRINCIAIRPNTNTLYVGAASGGIWVYDTTNIANNTTPWKTLSDYNLCTNNSGDLCALDISDIVFRPDNPNTMYVATGDAHNLSFDGVKVNSQGKSIGLLKSNNAGETWMPCTGLESFVNTNLTPVNRIFRIAMHPTNYDTIIVTTNFGIYYTTNGIDFNAASFPTLNSPNNLTFVDVEFNPTNHNIVYASNIQGEIWRSTDTGSSWTLEKSGGNNLSRTELAVAPSNDNIVYAIVAEGGLPVSKLHRVYKSTDAGLNFSEVYGQLQPTQHFNLLGRDAIHTNTNTLNDNSGQGIYDLAIIVDPTDENILYVGGINTWKSTDGGASWKTITKWDGAVSMPDLLINEHTGTLDSLDNTYRRVADGSYIPFGGSTCSYAPEGDYFYETVRLKPAQSNNVTINMNLTNFHNFDTNSTNIDSIGFMTRYPIPASYSYTFSSDSSCLDTNGNYIEILQALQDSYTGTFTDNHLIVISTHHKEVLGDYAIHFTNANGDTVDIEIPQPPIAHVHADIHTFEFGPTGELYLGCDGGIYKSNDNGTHWQDISRGLGITQYYKFGNSTDKVIAGAQDNGTTFHHLGVDSLQKWQEVFGGDGGDCAIVNNTTWYYSIQGGKIYKTTDGGNNHGLIFDSSNSAIASGDGAPFISPIALANDGTLYVGGYTNLYKTVNGGTSWSNVTTTITNLNNVFNKINVLELAPFNNQHLYISHEYNGTNSIYVSKNSGSTWSNLTGNWDSGNYLSDIAIASPISGTNERIWVSFSSNPNMNSQRVYYSSNGGSTWTNISGVNTNNGLPNLPVNTLAVHEDASGGAHIYAGTEVGVYYTNDVLMACSSPKWIHYSQTNGNNRLPNVIVSELEIVGNKLRAATYGRGVWETPLQTAACVCYNCEDPNYILEAQFTLTPLDCINNPNFDPNGDWKNNVSTGNPIIAEDASIGNNIVQYIWTTNPADLANNNPAVSWCNDIGPSDTCKRYSWAVAGTKTVTLTVVDANGCTDSYTDTLMLQNYGGLPCIEEFTPSIIQPYDLCDPNSSLCTIGNTGQINLLPNENFVGDISCYTFDLLLNDSVIDETPVFHDNGSISFMCLPPNTYTIWASNEVFACNFPYYDLILEPSSPSPNGSTLYASTATSTDNCTGEASITHIASEYMATAYHYNFAWSDCNPPESCNTFSRTGLCAGNYDITATNQLTGCSSFHSININDGTIADNDVFISVVLEGAVRDTTYMNTYARQANLLPIKQPYNRPPWNYNGSESVADTSDIPPTAVDWILVEARHEADTTQIAGRSAGFLLEDGNIVDTNGETLRLINLLENEKYYIIIRHRNHLAISSRNSITLPNTEGTKYDFTTSITQAKGNSQMRQLPSGKFAMCAGDANADGRIDVKDYNTYLNEASSINDYLPCDFDINTHTTIKDFNLMLNNSGAVGVDWIRYD